MLNRSHYWLIIALAIPAFIWLVPTIWMVSLSFQPNDVLARTTSTTALGLVPIPFTADNYAALFAFGQTPTWFLNSVIVALSMTLGVLAVSTTAGYALARLEFPFKSTLSVLCLIGLMVPEQAVFIPLYTMFADLGWHNSYQALILPRMAVPIGVFLMLSFFKAIPKDIEEAARLDGVGWLQIFWYVMLPLAAGFHPEAAVFHHHARPRQHSIELCAIGRAWPCYGLRRHRLASCRAAFPNLPKVRGPSHDRRWEQGIKRGESPQPQLGENL